MIRRLLPCGVLAALLVVVVAPDARAYAIDLSKGGLVDAAKAATGLDWTSPFDAEYDPGTKITDVWLTDMSGSYSGRRVFHWTLDESGGGEVWSYIGAFTTSNLSGIRALNIKSDTELLLAHGDGTIATYARDTGVAGYLDLGTHTVADFSIGAAPHHVGFDGTLLWTNIGYAGAFGTTGAVIKAFDLTGTEVTSFTSVGTYVEGVGYADGSVWLYNAGASVYGYPDDGYVGDILRYSPAGALEDVFEYESGDRPPFHSESLSFDGTHFWMAGYADGKVYRLAAEEDEVFFNEVPEPSTALLLGFGVAGLLWIRRRRRQS